MLGGLAVPAWSLEAPGLVHFVLQDVSGIQGYMLVRFSHGRSRSGNKVRFPNAQLRLNALKERKQKEEEARWHVGVSLCFSCRRSCALKKVTAHAHSCFPKRRH